MPKQVSESELQQILDLFAANPQIKTTEDVFKKIKPKIPVRTLQRRLSLLVNEKRLIANGRGPSRSYQLASVLQAMQNKEVAAESTESDSKITLSLEAEKIRRAVQKPLQQRIPAGYNPKFLENYKANKTFYLPLVIRKNLTSLGAFPVSNSPAGTYARKIYNRLIIDLSWNSSRLEGNTYSLLETQRLIELGEATEGKNSQEAQMILNHKAAIELLVEQAKEIGYNSFTVRNLHALLSDNLLSDPQACGRLRTIPVGISGSVFRPLEVPQLINERFQQILKIAGEIKDPFEQSFFVMVHLPYLQPFEDVNKRVSRLAANISLIRGNFCPLSFVDVPERLYVEGILGIYELNRIELLREVFVWAYQRSCARYSALRQSLGAPDPFRLKYRKVLAETVSEVVRQKLDKKHAATFVKQVAAKNSLQDERLRLIELIETELLSLHEGNISRYRLRPSEYFAWRQKWG